MWAYITATADTAVVATAIASRYLIKDIFNAERKISFKIANNKDNTLWHDPA